MGAMVGELWSDPKNNSTTACHILPGLSVGQSKLCNLYSDHMMLVASGAQQALQECTYQFQHRRWNCSLTSNDNNVFGPVLSLGRQKSSVQHTICD